MDNTALQALSYSLPAFTIFVMASSRRLRTAANWHPHAQTRNFLPASSHGPLGNYKTVNLKKTETIIFTTKSSIGMSTKILVLELIKSLVCYFFAFIMSAKQLHNSSRQTNVPLAKFICKLKTRYKPNDVAVVHLVGKRVRMQPENWAHCVFAVVSWHGVLARAPSQMSQVQPVAGTKISSSIR